MAFFEYSRWDGSQRFQPLPAADLFDQIAEHLLEYGEHVLRQLERLDPDDADILKQLIKEGYLERDEDGAYSVSAKGIRRMQDRALGDLFQISGKDPLGKHETDFRGTGQVQHEESRPYEFGDPTAHLNLHETLKNALIREGAGSPLHVREEDFVVHETEFQTSCATVLLLDMSGSMARYGKFQQAKRAALALQALIRGRFPEDSLRTIGFFTYASALTERQLIKAAPKPVTIFDSRVFLRVSLDKPPQFVPEHFTNIQAGLQFARRLLQKQPARNKQIICITDGEPTAHVEGRDLVLMYPPSERTSRATLQEVRRCAEAGIRLSTLALIEDYYYLDLKNFVDEMARLSRGLAVYCTAGDLGHYVFDSFVSGRRARRQVG